MQYAEENNHKAETKRITRVPLQFMVQPFITIVMTHYYGYNASKVKI